MNEFTYEANNTSKKLETLEWDNVWWEQLGNAASSRVLYIGDSISCGIRRVATAMSGELLFDGFGSSKALDNPYFQESVALFARQQGKRKIVLFNNGLHGWHLDDIEEYPYYYDRLVKFLLDEFKDTPVALVLTTSVAAEEREARVKRRNEAAVKIAESHGLPVIDLYSVSARYKEYRSGDGVH